MLENAKLIKSSWKGANVFVVNKENKTLSFYIDSLSLQDDLFDDTKLYQPEDILYAKQVYYLNIPLSDLPEIGESFTKNNAVDIFKLKEIIKEKYPDLGDFYMYNRSKDDAGRDCLDKSYDWFYIRRSPSCGNTWNDVCHLTVLANVCSAKDYISPRVWKNHKAVLLSKKILTVFETTLAPSLKATLAKRGVSDVEAYIRSGYLRLWLTLENATETVLQDTFDFLKADLDPACKQKLMRDNRGVGVNCSFMLSEIAEILGISLD